MSDWIRADKNAPRRPRPNNHNVATFLINNNHNNFFIYWCVQWTISISYNSNDPLFTRVCISEPILCLWIPNDEGRFYINTHDYTTVWKRSVTNREMFRRIFQLLLGLKPFIIVICNKLCKLKIVSQHFKNLN